MKVHKLSGKVVHTSAWNQSKLTHCNRYAYLVKHSNKWVKVTCKNCLKKRPKGGRG